ncbi:MAG TPA: hypothetical protein VGK38_05830, partial [Prolixibacteraceae bacterium]
LKLSNMNESGWISVNRKIATSDLWLSETFTRGQAWIDMLILANHKEGFIRVRGINVTIKRGQLGWSEVRLSERWKWSRTKTRHFLKELEKVQQIEQQKNAVSLLISIVNYDEYQNKDSKKLLKSTAEVQQKDTNNNIIDKSIIKAPWKSSYEVYKKECGEAFKILSKDEPLRAKIKMLYPDIDFDKSLMNAFLSHWGTEEGWEGKRKSKSDNINWKTTVLKTIKYNAIKS